MCRKNEQVCRERGKKQSHILHDLEFEGLAKKSAEDGGDFEGLGV
jgi:hypothetical protein